jgi:hypothetical protein
MCQYHLEYHAMCKAYMTNKYMLRHTLSQLNVTRLRHNNNDQLNVTRLRHKNDQLQGNPLTQLNITQLTKEEHRNKMQSNPLTQLNITQLTKEEHRNKMQQHPLTHNNHHRTVLGGIEIGCTIMC